MSDRPALTVDNLCELVTEARKRIAYDEEYEKLFEDYRAGKGAEKLIEVIEAREAHTKPLLDLLQSELRQRLEAASTSGRLCHAEPKDAPTVFHDIWPDLVDKGWTTLPDYRQKDLIKSLSEVLLNSIVFPKADYLGDEAAAEALIGHLEGGSLPETLGPDDLWINWADGKRLWVSMTNWTPRVFGREKDVDRRAPAQMPNGVMMHTTVNFPTGRLLVSDMVSVDPLPDILDQMRSVLGISINYAEHRVRRTWISASYLGVVDVAVGDAGPDIVREAATGRLYAGAEGEGFDRVARVCNDYWGTMIVDRETLITLAISDPEGTHTRESVEADIDAWLEGSQYANEITVAPGTWHLYWDDDRETLAAKLPKDGINAPEGTRFALTPEPLDLSSEDLRDLIGNLSVKEDREDAA